MKCCLRFSFGCTILTGKPLPTFPRKREKDVTLNLNQGHSADENSLTNNYSLVDAKDRLMHQNTLSQEEIESYLANLINIFKEYSNTNSNNVGNRNFGSFMNGPSQNSGQLYKYKSNKNLLPLSDGKYIDRNEPDAHKEIINEYYGIPSANQNERVNQAFLEETPDSPMGRPRKDSITSDPSLGKRRISVK